MEKRPEFESIKSNKEKDDMNYKVDLKKEKYSKIFDRIAKIFEKNEGYMNFIRNVANPILKEIYVLMRKYQYSFSKLTMNKYVIFDFANSDECLLYTLDSFSKNESENSLIFQIEIIPKFKKNEISFSLPDDMLRCNFEIKYYINDNDEFSFVESPVVDFLNLNNPTLLDPETYLNITTISKNLLFTFLNEYSQNFLQGLNKFITYIENYFPEIAKQSFVKSKEKKAEWSQIEQNILEAALIKYKNEKSIKEKFQKIAAEIKTKTMSECVKRYKELKELAINNIKENESTKETIIIEKTQEDNKNSNVDAKIEVISKPPENKIKVVKPSKENNKPESIVYNFTNTNDLVDEILNQFNNLYSNVKLNRSIGSEDEIQGDEYLDDISEDDEERQGSDYSYSEGDLEDEEIVSDYNPNRNKNNSKENDLKFIKNIILYGEKLSLAIEGLTSHNIGLIQLIDLNLHLKCGKCKQIAYESKVYKLHRDLDLLYTGAVCPKCQNHMHIVFKSELIHQANTNYAGTIYSMNVIVTDVLSTTYLINCLDCEDSYKKVNLRTGTIPFKDKNCRICQKEFSLAIKSVKLSQTLNNNTSFINDIKIENFLKFNMEINDYSDSKYIKLYDRVGQVGTPLPENGTCKHYAISFRWFRFGCCGKVYPCDHCHDEIEGHKSEYANNIVCGYCSFEQSSQNNLCSKCGKTFAKVMTNRGFWEGGKGTRNKLMMSSKDGHKFKNSKSKTISRKKIRENQVKQGINKLN